MTSSSSSTSNKHTATTNQRELTVYGYITQHILPVRNQHHKRHSHSHSPPDITLLTLRFYGVFGSYQAHAVGRNEYGEWGLLNPAITISHNAQITLPLPLQQLSSLISDPSDIFTGYKRVMVKDRAILAFLM